MSLAVLQSLVYVFVYLCVAVSLWQCNWLWIITAIIIFSHNAKPSQVAISPQKRQRRQCCWWWWQRPPFQRRLRDWGEQASRLTKHRHNLRLTILLITTAATSAAAGSSKGRQAASNSRLEHKQYEERLCWRQETVPEPGMWPEVASQSQMTLLNCIWLT